MALDTGKIIICSQFKEIPLTESVISRVNQLGLSEPAILTWTNRQGENIGDGPLWDAMPTSQNASISSTVAEATEEDDRDVIVAEVDQDDQTHLILSITSQECMMHTMCRSNGPRSSRMMEMSSITSTMMSR